MGPYRVKVREPLTVCHLKLGQVKLRCLECFWRSLSLLLPEIIFCCFSFEILIFVTFFTTQFFRGVGVVS